MCLILPKIGALAGLKTGVYRAADPTKLSAARDSAPIGGGHIVILLKSGVGWTVGWTNGSTF